MRRGPLVQLLYCGRSATTAADGKQRSPASAAVPMTFAVAGAFTWPSYVYGAPVVYPTVAILVQRRYQVSIKIKN